MLTVTAALRTKLPIDKRVIIFFQVVRKQEDTFSLLTTKVTNIADTHSCSRKRSRLKRSCALCCAGHLAQPRQASSSFSPSCLLQLQGYFKPQLCAWLCSFFSSFLFRRLGQIATRKYKDMRYVRTTILNLLNYETFIVSISTV